MSCAGMRLRLGREQLEGIYKKSKNKEGEPVVVSPPYFYGLCLFFSACMPARSRCSDIVLFPCLPGGSGAGVPVQLR